MLHKNVKANIVKETLSNGFDDILTFKINQLLQEKYQSVKHMWKLYIKK